MGSDRRRIPADKKMEIVLEGLEADNVAEFCRQKDIAEAQYYKWKKQLLKNGAEVFNTSSDKDPEKERLKEQLEETKEDLTEMTRQFRLLKKKDRLGFADD
jgi:transposase-like protein